MERANSIHIVKMAMVVIIITAFLVIMPSCGRHRTHRNSSITSRTINDNISPSTTSNGGKTTVKMRQVNGLYYVPCMINGTNMDFIFDTGASEIVMSLAEALFLFKQGKLSDDDVMGNVHFQIADGSIEEGTIVNLKEVTIGNKTIHDVEATIISNIEAPLLLGQSALSRFGTLSIDYNRNEITFE